MTTKSKTGTSKTSEAKITTETADAMQKLQSDLQAAELEKSELKEKLKQAEDALAQTATLEAKLEDALQEKEELEAKLGYSQADLDLANETLAVLEQRGKSVTSDAELLDAVKSAKDVDEAKAVNGVFDVALRELEDAIADSLLVAASDCLVIHAGAVCNSES
uniref:hypothetical protein n=1 Tax=uncultured Kiloniella sp. TaxID=1133091 RepID=UPI00260CE247